MNLAEAAVFLGKVGPAREQGHEAQFLEILDIPFFLSFLLSFPILPSLSFPFIPPSFSSSLPPSLPLLSFYFTQVFQQRSSVETFGLSFLIQQLETIALPDPDLLSTPASWLLLWRIRLMLHRHSVVRAGDKKSASLCPVV